MDDDRRRQLGGDLVQIHSFSDLEVPAGERELRMLRCEGYLPLCRAVGHHVPPHALKLGLEFKQLLRQLCDAEGGLDLGRAGPSEEHVHNPLGALDSE